MPHEYRNHQKADTQLDLTAPSTACFGRSPTFERIQMFFRHLLSVLILPFTVTVAIPYALVRRGIGDPSVTTIVVGLFVGVIGLVLVVSTIAWFASRGGGTLAPWDPPRHLVVRGIYRHVRNPMISGVLLILAGESLILGSREIGLWAAVVFAINAVYIPLHEEPALRRRFGLEYDEYSRHVPRWLPRISAWSPPQVSAQPGPRV
jgi:protein-S-isoprenylcysteine O-methyltransferase Ste14